MTNMDNDVHTDVISVEKNNEFKVIPVKESTRDRLKNNMMKRDTYDSYINQKLDRVEELEKIITAKTQE